MNYTSKQEKLNIDNKLDSLCEFFKTCEDIIGVFIFGTYGTTKQNNNSDIDLGILFSSEKTTWQICEVQAQVQEILGTERVDVVSLDSENIILAFEIIKDNRILYCKDIDKVTSFMLDIAKRYQYEHYKYIWANELCMEAIKHGYKVD